MISKAHPVRRASDHLYHHNNILLPDFPQDSAGFPQKLARILSSSTINGNASAARDYLSNGMADLAIVATGETVTVSLEFLPLREEADVYRSENHSVVPDF